MNIDEMNEILGTEVGDYFEAKVKAKRDGFETLIKLRGNPRTICFFLSEVFNDIVNNPNYPIEVRKTILKSIKVAANSTHVKEDK